MTLSPFSKRIIALSASLVTFAGWLPAEEEAQWMLTFDPGENHYIQSQATGLADGASQVSISSRLFVFAWESS